MEIFLLGDLESDNGPGNANKQIRDLLAEKYKVSYSFASGKFSRILEMRKGIRNADLLLICSRSKINYSAIRYAKKCKKKIIYLMHGYASYEEEIENPTIGESKLEQIRSYETFVFDAADQIVCVSKKCRDFMRKQLPQYENKLDYIYNVVDIEKIKKSCKENGFQRQKNKILSVGGGLKRKNNLIIAKSIERSRSNLEYVVVGKELEDGEKIKRFGFVTWIEKLPNEELIQVMNQSSLYIQNSSFETFGLAVIEALSAGCSLLISNEVGCKDLFETIRDTDIIFDITNEEEIFVKIEYLLREPNNQRMVNGFRKNWVSKEYQRQRWDEIIKKIYQEG